MVVYVYRCPSGHVVEHTFRMGTAPSAVPCPSCGAVAPRCYLPLPILSRPEGWSLSPEDPRYWSTLRDKEPRPRAWSE